MREMAKRSLLNQSVPEDEAEQAAEMLKREEGVLKVQGFQVQTILRWENNKKITLFKNVNVF